MDEERFEIVQAFTKDIMMRMADTQLTYKESASVLAMSLANLLSTVKNFCGPVDAVALHRGFGDTLMECMSQIASGDIGTETYGGEEDE